MLHVAPSMNVPEIVGVIVPTPLVVMMLFGRIVERAAAERAPGHRRFLSQQSRQSVTVSPISNSWTSGLFDVFRNVSRNSPMNGGAWLYRVSQQSQLNV
jgi:hypothetical protein